MALWPGWLSLIEEGVPALGQILEPAWRNLAGFLQLPRRQDLRQIRHNRDVAIFRVAVRVKALIALR